MSRLLILVSFSKVKFDKVILIFLKAILCLFTLTPLSQSSELFEVKINSSSSSFYPSPVAQLTQLVNLPHLNPLLTPLGWCSILNRQTVTIGSLIAWWWSYDIKKHIDNLRIFYVPVFLLPVYAIQLTMHGLS